MGVAIASSPRLLLAGFMLPTCLISFWISDTATVAMMMPTLDAVVDELDEFDREEKESPEGSCRM